MTEKPKRGFAAMDREAHRKIASMGGREAHRLGKAHRYTKEEASAAGKIGGRARRKKNEKTDEALGAP